MKKIIFYVALLSLFSILLACNSDKIPVKGDGGMLRVDEIMKKSDIFTLREGAPKLIGKDWMMITAGDSANFNTMTASWGTMGYLWERPVVFVFIRPQRYTNEFIEANNYFTLTFYDEKYRDALNITGSRSGRDTDKVVDAGITPIKTENSIAFAEGRMIVECRKIYADFFNPDGFVEKSLIEKQYERGDFHRIYIGEIVNVWKK